MAFFTTASVQTLPRFVASHSLSGVEAGRQKPASQATFAANS
jgi:hypothetical protein